MLLGGLFLSFSRGAWLHFLISAAVCVVLLLAVTHDTRQRTRIFALAIAAAIAVALLLIAVLSISSIHDMFLERAKAFQPYDLGPGGRFWLQRVALGAILENPNGLGPFEFGRIYGFQQHNVYMEAFLVFGWLGGTTYFALVLITLGVGFAASACRRRGGPTSSPPMRPSSAKRSKAWSSIPTTGGIFS